MGWCGAGAAGPAAAWVPLGRAARVRVPAAGQLKGHSLRAEGRALGLTWRACMRPARRYRLRHVEGADGFVSMRR